MSSPLLLLSGASSSPCPGIAQDKTFEFEKRRNVPIKYSRDLVQTTLQAMKRIAEIKARRERAFWKNRYVPRLALFSFRHSYRFLCFVPASFRSASFRPAQHVR